MKFYIKQSGLWTEVQVEIDPLLVKALDTTNDSFSCTLKASSTKDPYKPMTLFKIQYDDLTEQVFVIQNDSVSVFSLNPLVYKHTLNVVQYRYVMHKHLVRNTVLNQPKIKRQKLYAALTSYYHVVSSDNKYKMCIYGGVNPVAWYDSVKINSHTRVKNLSLKMQIFAIARDGQGTDREIKRMENLNELYSYNAQTRDTVNFHIYDTNTNTTIYTVYLNNYILNRLTVDNQIKNAINQYISEHSGANLALMYFVGENNQGTEVDMSFVTAVDGSIVTYNLASFVTLRCEIELELYNYTMYDVLDTLLKQNRLTSSSGSKRTQPFYLKNSGDLYNLLTTTYPPDTMTFTQATWYDVLTEIFRFYDAGFRFELGNLNRFYLEIEYYNDRKSEITQDFSGISLSHSDRNFNNGKVAFYQNAVQEIELHHVNTRSSVLGVPQKSEYEIVLPKPIYDVESLSMRINGRYALFNNGAIVVNMDLDLSPFIVNSEIWTTLDKNDSIYEISQRSTMKFDRGSKTINLSSYYRAAFNIEIAVMDRVITIAFNRFFGFSRQPSNLVPHIAGSVASALGTDWAAQMFNIKYLTENSGRAEMETVYSKYKGNEIVNQNDGLIDLNKLGLNILGESLKNGEPTLTATYKIAEWEDIPKEGDYITYNNEIWVVNIVNCKVIKNGYYQCTLEFSKNFNALSMRVHSDNEKRLTNISRSLAVLSEDNFIDYIYVDDKDTNISYQATALGNSILKDCLNRTFNYYDGTSYTTSFSVTITTSDWRQYGGAQTLEVSVDHSLPIELVDENIRGGQYNSYSQGLAGETMQSYSISNTVAGETNTINFDNDYDAGQPLGVVGRFYGKIYYDKRDESTETATISFTLADTPDPFWVAYYYYDAPEYIGKNVHNIVLSGFSGTEQRVTWNESLGYFYIYLRTDTQPSADVNLTISFSYNAEQSKTVEVATINVNSQNFYMPLIKYGFGNSICFEMQMDDPISAGNQMIISSGWFGSNKYFSQATPYTDDEGWLDNLTVNFYAVTETGKTYGIGNYPKIQESITIPFPFGDDITISLLSKVGSINNLQYLKKPNEIFALNYEWCFLSYNFNDFFIGSKFINENAMTIPDQMPYKTFRLVYANDNFKYSVLDIKGHGEPPLNSTDIKADIVDNKVLLYIKLGGIIGNNITAKNWAIVDENNDIYFASNTQATFTHSNETTKVITFTTRRDRL